MSTLVRRRLRASLAPIVAALLAASLAAVSTASGADYRCAADPPPAAAAPANPAPSYTCSGGHVMSESETVVCADDDLAALDRELEAAVARVGVGGLDQGRGHYFGRAQIAFRFDRDSCGASKPCIRNAYLAELCRVSNYPDLPRRGMSRGGQPRAGPGTNHPIAATLPNGTQLMLVERFLQPSGYDWFQIGWRDRIVYDRWGIPNEWRDRTGYQTGATLCSYGIKIDGVATMCPEP